MADTPVTARQFVPMSEREAAQMVAHDFAEIMKPENRPDVARGPDGKPAPGGYYLDARGEPIDANGNKLGKDRPKSMAAADSLSSEDVAVRLKELDEERAALQARAAVAAGEEQRAAAEGVETARQKEREKSQESAPPVKRR